MELNANFEEIKIFEVEVKYYYIYDNARVDIGEQTVEVEKNDLPKKIVSPNSTQVEQDSDHPIYCPEIEYIELTAADVEPDKIISTREDGAVTIGILETREIQYIPFNTTYFVVHKLKDLEGDGYSEIDREPFKGIQGTKVTPLGKNYTGAEFERADTAELTEDDQEIDVYYTRKSFTLRFNSNGGNYVDAITEKYETVIDLTDITTEYNGYSFQGWYLDSELTTKATDNLKLTEDTILYAKWEAGTANYSIVYMLENANDDGFSYFGTVEGSGTIGTNVTADASTEKPAGFDSNNFTFKEASTEVVKADGSTVVTVKYSRNVYTIKNYSGRPSRSVTAKYGANIFDAFQSAFIEGQSGAWSIGSGNNEDKIVSMETMPSPYNTEYDPSFVDKAKGIIYAIHFNFTTENVQILNYWLENYTDTDQTKEIGGKTYGLFRTVRGQFGFLYYDVDFYEIKGYTQGSVDATNTYQKKINGKYQTVTDDVSADFANWKSKTSGIRTSNYTLLTLNMYYDAETYPLTFIDYNGATLGTYEVAVGLDVTSYVEDNSDRSEKPIDDATWDGWKTDAARTTPFAADESGKYKMPGGGLVLYANYLFPIRKFTFVDPFTGEDVVLDIEDVEHGQTVASLTPETAPEGHEFGGWYTDKDYTKKYDFLQPVTADTTIYAKWDPKPISYSVYYVDEDGNDVALSKTVTRPEFRKDMEITEEALSVVGMYADSDSKSITLGYSDNEITFVYKIRPDEIVYKVRYIYLDGDKEVEVAPEREKTVPGNTVSVAEVPLNPDYSYIDPEYQEMKFHPTESIINHTFSYEDVNNVITFYYLPYETGKVTVNYVDMDGNPIISAPSITKNLQLGDTYTIETDVEGYVKHRIEDSNGHAVGTKVIAVAGETVRYVYMQKKLTITAKDKRRAYDGTPLMSSGIADLEEPVGLVEGHSIDSIEYEGQQLYAGKSPTTPKNAVISGPTSDEYYVIDYVAGELEILKTEIVVEIELDKVEVPYDGTEHTATYKVKSISNDVFKEEYIKVIGTPSISGIDADAKKPLNVQFAVKDEYVDTFDVTFNYVNDGYLYITKRPLYVTTASITTTYPEPAQINEGTVTGFVEGEGYSELICNGIREHVVEYDRFGNPTEFTENTIDDDGIVFNSNTKASNYYVDWYDSRTKLGELRVLPREITVKVDGHISDPPYKYDGAEHTEEGYDIVVDSTDEKDLAYRVSGDVLDYEGPAQNEIIRTETEADQYPLGLVEETVVDEGTQFKNTNTDYKVTFVVTDGYLLIVPLDTVVVTITGATDTLVYNGKEQSVTGYEISLEDPTGGYSLDSLIKPAQNEAIAKGTAVDEYSMGLDEQDDDGNYTRFVNTDTNYDVQLIIQDGKLTIEKAKIRVEVTGNTDEVLYNGSEQTVTGYEIENVLLVNGNEEKDAKDLYTEDKYSAPAQQDAVAAGTEFRAEAYLMGLSEDDFTNLDEENFEVEFKVTDGSLRINKLPIVVYVEGNSDEVPYNGQEQSVNGYEVKKIVSKVDGTETETDLYKEDYFDGPVQDDAKVTAKGTEVGTYTMTVSRDDFAPNDDTINNNFEVSFEVTPGTLDIIPDEDEVIVYVKGNVKTVPYNGEYQSVEGWDTYGIIDPSITISLVEGQRAYVEGKDVDEYPMGLQDSYFEASSPNYSKVTVKIAEENGEKLDGKLIITPIERTAPEATGYDDVYDGQEHSIELTGTINGDEVFYTYVDPNNSGSVVETTQAPVAKDVAQSVGNVNITVKNKNYLDVELDPVPLNIQKRPVSVKTESATKEYDGTPLTNEDASIVAIDGNAKSGLVEGETATVKASGYQTEVGGDEHNNTYEPADITWGSADENNYELVADESLLGTLKVTANTTVFNVYAPDATKSYDGTKLEKTDEVRYDAVPILADFTVQASAKAETELVNVGTTRNLVDVFKIISKTTGEEVTDNFGGINMIPGTLTITKAKISVTTESATKVYDGEPLVAGGTVTVTGGPEAATVTGSDSLATSEYNAETDVFEKAITLLNGETATFKITGRQIEAGGEVENNTYQIVFDGTAISGNYEETEIQKGTLTVTNADANTVVVTLTGGTYEYNGLDRIPTVDVTVPEGWTYYATYTADSVGHDVVKHGQMFTSKDVKLDLDTFVIKNPQGTDVTKDLMNQGAVTINEGQMTILPVELSIVTPTASKPYDGTPLTAEGKITGFVTVDGVEETATFTTTGSVTEPAQGKVDNTYTLVFDGTAKEDNYSITKSIGKLSVVKNNETAIIITAPSDEKIYDGKALVADGKGEGDLAVKIEGLPTAADGSDLFTVEVTISSNVKHVSDTATGNNKITRVVIKQGRKTVTPYFGNITRNDGTLTIKPAPLTVTTPSASKNYDGLPLSKEGKVTGFVSGENATFTTTGTVTYPDEGQVSNTYKLVFDKNAIESDYAVNPNLGTLQIFDRPLDDRYKIYATPLDEQNRIYNGQVQTGFDYTIRFETITDSEVDVIETEPQTTDLLQSAFMAVKDFVGGIAEFVSDAFTINAGAASKSGEYTDDKGRSYKATVNADVKADREAKNVGDYVLSMDEDSLGNYKVVDVAGKDVSRQFVVVPDGTGALTIDPATAVVTAGTYTKYQGNADPTFSVTVRVPSNGSLQSEAIATIKPIDISRVGGEAIGDYAITPNGPEAIGNFVVNYVNGVLHIIGTTPPPDNPPTTPGTPTTTVPDAPVPAAPTPVADQAVLGARRETENGQAVLGARRSKTEDEANDAARVIIIVMSAAAALLLLLTGKKKEDEES